MKILHIDASASDAETSHSRRLSAALVNKLTALGDASVTRRDVAADPLPHVDTTIRQAWMPETQDDPAHADVRHRSSTLIDELRNADTIVIGSPMYNFSVPSTLKAWVDHIAVAGQTFRYTAAGPEGLLADKKVYLVLSSGGIYSQGPFQAYEHLDNYLRAIFGFLGVTSITTLRAEGTAMGPEMDEKAMQDATGQIEELVAA
jgi:FMN-dependent NADH-azoreductase